MNIAKRKRPAAWWTAGLMLLGVLPLAAQERPNLEGVWKLAQPQAALMPADKRPVPFTEKGRAQYGQNKLAAANGNYNFDPTMSRCSSPGLPRLMLTPDRFRIFQRSQVIAMAFEWNRVMLFTKREVPAGRDGQPASLYIFNMFRIQDGKLAEHGGRRGAAGWCRRCWFC